MKMTNFEALLKCPLEKVAKAVAKDVKKQVAGLRKQGVSLAGYVLAVPMEFELRAPTSIHRCTDEEVPKNTHRLNANDWAHWEQSPLPETEKALRPIAKKFEAAVDKMRDAMGAYEDEHGETMEVQQVRDGELCEADAEDALSDVMLAFGYRVHEAYLEGLASAKEEGVFGPETEFLAVWIPGDMRLIMPVSVRRLCSKAVQKEFFKYFEPVSEKPYRESAMWGPVRRG